MEEEADGTSLIRTCNELATPLVRVIVTKQQLHAMDLITRPIIPAVSEISTIAALIILVATLSSPKSIPAIHFKGHDNKIFYYLGRMLPAMCKMQAFYITSRKSIEYHK